MQVRGKRKKNREPSRGVDQSFDEGTPFNPHLKAAILLKRGRRLSDFWLQGTQGSRLLR